MLRRLGTRRDPVVRRPGGRRIIASRPSSAMRRSDSCSAMNTVTAGVAGVCAFSSEALYVPRSKYDFGRFDFSYAFQARGFIVTMATPGGAPQAFCEAVM